MKLSMIQQSGPEIYLSCAGCSASARSQGITSAMCITPMIAPFFPQRCNATSPRIFSPHDRFSTRFAPLAMSDANGSRMDRAFKTFVSFMQAL